MSISIIEPSRCLATALIEELLVIPHHDWRQVAIILPTKRLATYILAGLTHHVPHFLPPVFMTWDEFMDSQTLEESAVCLSPVEFEFLILEHIKNSRHLAPGHAHELSHLFSEIWRHSDGVQFFTKLKEHLTSTGDTIFLERTIEIEEIYTRVTANMGAEFSMRDELMARKATLLSARITSGDWQAPWSRIIVAGITSLTFQQQTVFHALKNKADIWLHRPIGKLIFFNPLAQLWQQEVEPSPTLDLWSRLSSTEVALCDSVSEECLYALRKAREFISEGTSAHLIGILLPDELRYATVMHTLVSELKIDANVPLPMPFVSSSAGSWLAGFCQLLLSRDVRSFLNWFNHPLHPKGAVDTGATALLSQWNLSWSQVKSACLPQLPPHVAHILQTWSQIDRFEAKSTKEWMRLLADIWSLLTASPQTEDQSQLVQAENEILREVEQTLFRTLSLASQPFLPMSDVLQTLLKIITSLSIRQTGDPLRGLQILNLTEARFIPFERVILTGCYEGGFPHAVPRDEIIDDHLKNKAGLPGYMQLEALEDTTFHLMAQRVPHLCITYPKQIGGMPVVASRYVEYLRLAKCSEQQISLENELLQLKPAAELRKPHAPSEEGQLAASWQKFSWDVSAAQNFLRCPYLFLASQLGIRPVDPLEPGDPRISGIFVHKVLELFFDTKSETFEPFRLPPRGEFSEYAVTRLKAITANLLQRMRPDPTLVYQLNAGSWKRFAEFCGELIDKHGPEIFEHPRCEWGFGTRLSFALPEFAKQVEDPLIKGRIDLILQIGNTVMIIDYKTGGTPTGVAKGFEPQLPIYSKIVAAAFGTGQVNAGYWNVRDGIWYPVAEVSSTVEAVDNNLEWRRSTLRNVDTTVTEGSLSERFYADASDCGLCHLEFVCRKADPSTRLRMRSQQRLKAYKSNSTKASEL
jgi:RecB family exonuclease